MRAAASSLTIGLDAAALANCLRRDPGREDSGTTPATARSSVRAIKQNNNARRDSEIRDKHRGNTVRWLEEFGSISTTRCSHKIPPEIFFPLCILMPYSNS